MLTSFSVILICPDDGRRRGLARAVEGQQGRVIREFTAYPNFSHLLTAVQVDCDAVIIDIDHDLEVALDLIENIGAEKATTTVIAYSRSEDPELLVRCMRVGAREFLTDPVSSVAVAESLVRAAARRTEIAGPKKVSGKLLVFWGAKGGSGVTTLASNFAIALLKESGRQVALLDFNLQLGDIGVTLGLTPRFTLLDAVQNAKRLDVEFVSTLLTAHSSGVAVLPGADEYIPSIPLENGTLSKLVYLVREQFPYVVVDAGPALGPKAQDLFYVADQVYLVSQIDVPSLRNAQRFLAHSPELRDRVQVVLNRFEPRKLEFDEDRVTKVLGHAPRWKVPNDYGSVRRSQNTGTALLLTNSPVSKALHEMARAACGKPLDSDKKRKFGFFA